MIRPEGETEPLLRRPLAVYRRSRERTEFLLEVVGRGTRRLSRLRAGDRLDLLGPLGRPFPAGPAGALHLYVAGGIGAASLFWPARESLRRGRRTRVLYGARTRAALVCAADFRRAGIPIACATDDGSAGHAGFVTDLLEAVLCAEGRGVSLFVCGPWAMMARTAEIARRFGVRGVASIEARMGCGMGTCLGCAVSVTGAPGGGTARVCTEGPVFDLDRVAWS